MGAAAPGLPRLIMAKLRPLLLLILFILLIVLTLKFEARRRENQQERSSAKNIPEFFLEQSLTTSFTSNGKVDYQMNSDYLEYFKHGDTANIKNAYFIFYNENGHTWHSRSDTATLFNTRDEIDLSGNVRIWQPDSQLEITTQGILLSNSRSVAETSEMINLKSPSGNLQSQGMKADLNEEKLQFISAVSSEYHTHKEKIVPKKPKKKARKPILKGTAHAK
jgi:LPS export ABC transporter protein LptC